MEMVIDGLNIPLSRKISEPFEKYFGDMDLTKEEKEKRIKVAKKLDNAILPILSLIWLTREENHADKDYLARQIKQGYMDAIGGYMDADKYTDDYVRRFSNTFIQTTLDNINDEWYLSADRSRLTAENESESVWNYDDYKNAVKSGKTKKKWMDIKDKKERETHREVGGKVIPINDTFVVGNSIMRFPKDTMYGADLSEIANCRCTIKYM